MSCENLWWGNFSNKNKIVGWGGGRNFVKKRRDVSLADGGMNIMIQMRKEKRETVEAVIGRLKSN